MNITMHLKLKIQLNAVCIAISLVNGAIVHTKYARTSGNGVRKLACARDAADRNYLATVIDTTKSCSSLDWDWGSAPTFDTGSTYFEKKRVTESYDPPMVLAGTMKLPIAFYAGAYIDMYIEFTVLDFSYGCIRLLDTLDDSYDTYSGDSETIMINMELKPTSNNIIFKTWWFGWVNHGFITPFPFTVGPVYKITFKALTTEIQVLFDDVEVDRINHYVQPEDARILTFSNKGWLLHKMEFVGA